MASTRAFNVIVAATFPKLGIGVGNSLPWRLPKEMSFFRAKTSQVTDAYKRNAVIMGRKTWESLPISFRPLPKRVNVVLSTNTSLLRSELERLPDVFVAENLDAALNLLSVGDLAKRVESVFVIGGGEVYKYALAHPSCEAIFITRILDDIPAVDIFLPPIDQTIFHERSVSPSDFDMDGVSHRLMSFEFATYCRSSSPACSEQCLHPLVEPCDERSVMKQSNPEERQYLELVRDVIEHGVKKEDRTGVGTLSKFGSTMRFSLRGGSFPLLTTKSVFWRGVVAELLWMVHGCTDSKVLNAKGVKIWDGNGSRAFLDKLGFTHREEGDLGPVYGHQWRFFGSKYVDCHTNYSGQGVDQLADVIHRIRHEPNSRRIVLNAWNAADLKDMALPPCHMMAQFYVANGELSCIMYQRSCDLGLGVPFNIASYSLLTYMIAHVTGLKPGEFIHMLGDTHVYLNHVDPLKEQLCREPRAFPFLRIRRQVKEVDDFVVDDFELNGYYPDKTIKMEMAV